MNPPESSRDYCITMARKRISYQRDLDDIPVTPNRVKSCSPDWFLDGYRLKPSYRYTERLNTALFDESTADATIRFIFDPSYATEDIFIHESRLSFAKGPFQALLERPFAECISKTVNLAICDNPVTFTYLRHFLYGKHIDLRNCTLHGVLDVARSSHRWQLLPLLHVTLDYIRAHMLLKSVEDILATIPVISFPDLPDSFQTYFWTVVGRFFPSFSSPPRPCNHRAAGARVSIVSIPACDSPCSTPVQDAEPRSASTSASESPPQSVEARLCPLFPQLWPLAAELGKSEVTLEAILASARSRDPELARWLLDVILQYLEPQIPDDVVVCRMIRAVVSQLGSYCDEIVQCAETDKVCSTRAMRLLYKANYISDRVTNEEGILRKQTRYGRARSAIRWQRSISNDFSLEEDDDLDDVHWAM